MRDQLASWVLTNHLLCQCQCTRRDSHCVHITIAYNRHMSWPIYYDRPPVTVNEINHPRSKTGKPQSKYLESIGSSKQFLSSSSSCASITNISGIGSQQSMQGY